MEDGGKEGETRPVLPRYISKRDLIHLMFEYA